MKKPCEVIIVNDKSFYNTRYRLPLIKKLTEHYSVTSLGLFDDFYSIFIIFFKAICSRNSILISSNLKSNLIILSLFWKKKLIIINGLGRFREKKILRFVLNYLIKMQKYKTVIQIQNYADYRYFRKHCGNESNVGWLPGSGGVKRLLGHKTQNISVITRDAKLRDQLNSIKDFITLFWAPKLVTIVGVRNSKKYIFNDDYLQSVGYVEQSQILSFSKNILIPNGYGEGIPHTLVDAITSDANIYLSKKSFIQYGFYRFTTYRKLIGLNNWVNLIVNDELKELVGSEYVTTLSIEQIKSIQ